MENAGMVLPTIDHVHSETSFDITSNGLNLRFIKKISSVDAKSETVFGGVKVEGFRKYLAAREIS